jgi:hypothetical protein
MYKNESHCKEYLTQAEELPHYMMQFKSEDPKVQYVGLVGIRKILAIRNILYNF